MRRIVAFLVTAGLTAMALMGGSAAAGDKKDVVKTTQPTWAELVNLVGKTKDSAEFKSTIKKYNMQCLPMGSGGIETHISADLAASLLTSDKGVVVHVLVSAQYAHKLPHGLTMNMAPDQVKKTLGKPTGTYTFKYPKGPQYMLEFKEKRLRVVVGDGGISSIKLLAEWKPFRTRNARQKTMK